MISGFAWGHHTANAEGWLTGTTVVVAPEGAVGGVDVRGGGPGTRETDLLSPSTFMPTVHAITLSGGSAYGLAAADGVMGALEQRGIGFGVATPQATDAASRHRGAVVPIVPTAVIFDLGRGGQASHRPDASFGARALQAAWRAHENSHDPAMGTVGAGTGAVAGGLKGGFGYAETTVPDSGWRVGAGMVVNPVGSPVDPDTGLLWAHTTLDPEDPRRRLRPTETARSRLQQEKDRLTSSLNTCVGVITTDAALTKAEAGKVAQIGHDGLARAIRPVHSMADGDTMFCLASGTADAPSDPVAQFAMFDALLTAAATTVERACAEAMWAATSAGVWTSYADVVDAPAAH